MSPLLLLASLALMFAGLVLLIEGGPEDLRELTPPELSTSAPVARSLRERIQDLVGRCSKLSPPRPRRSITRPRPAVLDVLDMAEISAGRTLFCGRVADLRSPSMS